MLLLDGARASASPSVKAILGWKPSPWYAKNDEKACTSSCLKVGCGKVDFVFICIDGV